MENATCEPCPTNPKKKRGRPKKKKKKVELPLLRIIVGKPKGTEFRARKDALAEIVNEFIRVTIRQVFYPAVSRGFIEKSEAGYDKIQYALAQMREDGELPYSAFVDYTRAKNVPATWYGIPDALTSLVYQYRRDPWQLHDCQIQIWLEKSALEGIVAPVTHEYCVPLYVSRGFSSTTLLNEAGRDIQNDGRPCYVYLFSDHDPSGESISASVDTALRKFAPDTDIHFTRVAVLREQIEQYNLPTRPPKKGDSRSKGWEGGCVELDAFDPNTLRMLIRSSIERHIDPPLWEHIQLAQQAEEKALREFVATFGDAA